MPLSRREISQNYREKHRELERERGRRWREANPEKMLAAVKRWKLANPERHREMMRKAASKYVRTHKATVNANQAARYARKTQAMPAWLDAQDRRDIKDWYALAASSGQTVDHIVPLRGKNVCGLHVAWNLQLLPFNVNLAKGNRLEPAK